MPKIDSYNKNKKYNSWNKVKLSTFKLKSGLIIFAWLMVLFLALMIVLFVYVAKDLPNPQNLTERQWIESTKIFDRTGKIVLYDVHGEEKRTIIPFEEIPQDLKNATIIAEDTKFYSHFGLDFKGIIRAFLYNLKGQEISQGGSTITQQFIKNALLTSEKTYTRKLKEAILAIETEIKYSKDEILGFYLNQIPYGSNAYGIEAASQTFFNKNAKNLTLAESALLAALTKATTYYSPHGSHLDELKSRQEHILDRMYEYKYITKEQMENAKKEELNFNPPKTGIKAPHFVMYIKEYLEQRYGRDFIEKAGLNVYTTLDWDLQQIAETAIRNGSEKNGKKYNAQNSALVATDPKTGQILAMVGSKDYWAESYPVGCKPGIDCLFEPNVNVATRPRQPGSSFKPFAYAKAFQKGFTPDTMLFDLKTEFNPNCSSDATQGKDQYGLECYHPKNYDGKFRGPVSMKNSLAQSLNVPSVKTLYLAGVNETLNLAQDMGISTLKDRSRYGLSLVLGGGEVKLLEETLAFGVFAADGIKHKPASILKIEDTKGNIIEQYEDVPQKIIEPQIARLISDILSDENARAPIFGYKSNLYIEGLPVAAKTGTTQEYRDGWTVGYTPSLAVGVWTGNNNNTPINKEPGAVIAAPIWNEFIKRSYQFKKDNQPSTDQSLTNYFNLPEQLEEFIEPELIPTNKDVLNGSFIERSTYSQPQIHCILYYVNKENPQGEEDGKNDPLFRNWEQPVLSWVANLPDGYLYNRIPSEEPEIIMF